MWTTWVVAWTSWRASSLAEEDVTEGQEELQAEGELHLKGSGEVTVLVPEESPRESESLKNIED